MSGGGGRKPRLEQALRDELAQMVGRDIRDPRVKAAGLITIHRVELNKDLRVARVYVSFFGADRDATARGLEGLDAAAGFLRGPLGRRLHLQHPPELRFVHDDSATMLERLREVAKEDAARNAANPPDASPMTSSQAADGSASPHDAGGGSGRGEGKP